MPSNDVVRADILIERIKPILAGEGLLVQGAVIASLTAIWLAAHPKQQRPAIWAMHMQMTEPLVALEAERLGTGV